MALLEEYAPLKISLKAIEKGDYDNSGLIVKNSENVSKILFSLDISLGAVKRAEEIGADTIVTHHPAIYNPIKRLAVDGENAGLLSAIKKGMNVISMHLNLDMADDGIDQCLAQALGAKKCNILSDLDGKYGYGREFLVGKDLRGFEIDVKKTLKSEKIVTYGEGAISKAASFCGGGSDYAFKAVANGDTDADIIISSDMPHHVLSYLVEKNKKVMIIPHYVAEQYGFNKFFTWVKEQVKDNLQVEYFEDKRFM